jgi:hypothetical protein
MKIAHFLSIAAPLALAAMAAQAARPVVLENSATFTTPDPNYHYFARHVAVDGDNAIALGEFFDAATGNDAVQRGVFWFQRQSSGTWTFKRKLVDSYSRHHRGPGAGLQGRRGGGITDKLHVWELIAGDLVESVVDPSVANDVNGPELAIDAGRILGSNPSHCSWDGAMFTKVSGVWTVTTRFPGPSFDCAYAQPVRRWHWRAADAVVLASCKRPIRAARRVVLRVELPADAGGRRRELIRPQPGDRQQRRHVSRQRSAGSRHHRMVRSRGLRGLGQLHALGASMDGAPNSVHVTESSSSTRSGAPNAAPGSSMCSRGTTRATTRRR